MYTFLRYAPEVFRSGVYGQRFREIEVCVINALDRKVTGEGRTERVLASHAAAGGMCARNVYIQHCAELLDLELQAYSSSISG